MNRRPAPLFFVVVSNLFWTVLPFWTFSKGSEIYHAGLWQVCSPHQCRPIHLIFVQVLSVLTTTASILGLWLYQHKHSLIIHAFVWTNSILVNVVYSTGPKEIPKEIPHPSFGLCFGLNIVSCAVLTAYILHNMFTQVEARTVNEMFTQAEARTGNEYLRHLLGDHSQR